MEATLFGRIRDNLLTKRENLAGWLQTAPVEKRRTRLGPSGERAMHEHLRVLDDAVERCEHGTLGICEICGLTVEQELLAMDYTACVCLEHLTGQQRRELEAELELSQRVQKALLPQRAPAVPGLDLSFFSRPAQIIGGDYFDFVRFDDGAHGLAIGDVAGHGLSASLLMASLQSALQTLSTTDDEPARVLAHLNRFFLHNVHITTFVTLFLGRYDARRRTLTYANAGHNPPLLVRGRANGKPRIEWLQPTAAAIGLVESFEPSAEEIALATGDVLLLYTDGVTEAMNSQGEEYGQERLAALALETAHLPAREIALALREQVMGFGAADGLADDTTVVVCKVVAN